MARDFKQIFEALDTSNNTFLSLNEFSMHLEGAKLKFDQRIQELPQDIRDDMAKQIDELFTIFDENGDQRIDQYELMKTFQGLGYEMNEARALELIASVDDNNDKVIDRTEFQTLMLPEMQRRLLEQDDRVEDFRGMFKDADTDYSGYLTADEVYTVLLKNGIDLKYDELI